MKRYCRPDISSRTVKSSRVSSVIGTGRPGPPPDPEAAAATGPAFRPVIHRGTSAPSRCMTRATLMPPPPGSRRSAVQRILWNGTNCPMEVQASIDGLMVRVTMSAIHPSPESEALDPPFASTRPPQMCTANTNPMPSSGGGGSQLQVIAPSSIAIRPSPHIGRRRRE